MLEIVFFGVVLSWFKCFFKLFFLFWKVEYILGGFWRVFWIIKGFVGVGRRDRVLELV